MTKAENDSFGIYERGQGSYAETISFWSRQRHGIAKRLRRFANLVDRAEKASQAIDDAIKKNGNGLPF